MMSYHIHSSLWRFKRWYNVDKEIAREQEKSLNFSVCYVLEATEIFLCGEWNNILQLVLVKLVCEWITTSQFRNSTEFHIKSKMPNTHTSTQQCWCRVCWQWQNHRSIQWHQSSHTNIHEVHMLQVQYFKYAFRQEYQSVFILFCKSIASCSFSSNHSSLEFSRRRLESLPRYSIEFSKCGWLSGHIV